MTRTRQAADDDEHRAQERAYADAHADDYVREMHQGPWPIYRARIEDRLFARLPAPRSVLDVGCGPLPSLPRVYERAERYLAVDPSRASLDRWRDAFPRARTVQGDAESLPFDGPFDLVLVLGVLHHVPHPAIAVSEAFRVLEPGGLIVAMEPNEENEMWMDSPNERGIPNDEFEHLYSCFETLDRWGVFEASYWKQVMAILSPAEVADRWPRPETWNHVLQNEDAWLSEHPGGSMNLLIARKPTPG